MSEKLRVACILFAAVIGAAHAQDPATDFKAGDVQSVDLGGGVTLELVWIAPGTFLLGSPVTEEGRDKDEMQHEVTLTRGFWMGKYEITVGQFKRFVEESGYQTTAERKAAGAAHSDQNGKKAESENKSWRNTGFAQTDAHPVALVSWEDAQAFCEWISKKAGGTFRLPTEAQWEYACRAGTTTARPTGDSDTSLLGRANLPDVSDGRIAQNPDALLWRDGYEYTAPVGSFEANAWGLHDMLGNVWEWCADYYNLDFYERSPREDPENTKKEVCRVLRGGSWDYTPWLCRSANRAGGSPSDRFGFGRGFRVVRVMPAS